MRLILITLVLLLTVGCATRNTPCETLDSAKSLQAVSPQQTAQNIDVIPGIALADSDGDAISAPQAVGVEVQAQNQNTGPSLQISPLVGGQETAARILSTTSPGEQHVLDSLASLASRKSAISNRLDNDPALTDTERARLQAALRDLDGQEPMLLAKLDKYAEHKVASAARLVPDLSGLQSVIYMILTPQAAGAGEYPLISDEQAKAIGTAAKTALESRPTFTGGDPEVSVPQPPPAAPATPPTGGGDQ